MTSAPFLVDSHCHLDYPELSVDLDGVMARARNAGVGHLLTIGTKLSAFPGVLAAAERYPNVSCSVGIHPHDAATEVAADAERLMALAEHPKVVAFGETGLDFYYEHSPRDQQERSFRAHLAAARRAKLPVIVHTRDADEDMARVLREEMGQGPFTGVIHCFSSEQQLADMAIDIGLYISISGIVTFKKADALRAVVKSVPIDRLLVETDSPYLAPVPYRGKTNEPAYVAKTAAMVAELKGLSVADLTAQTTANFFRLFAKAVPEQPAAS
ncbi:MAG: TatD family deoxyribonuclease [Rhodospirillaceae bacterium]|nr:MAG: TatD family deoxyribonuclease [Rhodospirillaceae bacterium]